MTICDDLRQSVLQAAIQGKLTKQLPEDGTAGDLLASIKAEKEQLIKEKKIKKEKPLAPIAEDEIPFDIPESWVWIRLASAFQLINGDRGKNYPSKDKLSEKGAIPFISAINMSDCTIKKDGLLFVSQTQYDALGSGKLNKNDFVFCLRGSLGKFCKYPFEQGAIASSLVILRKIGNIVDDYIKIYLSSPLIQNQINESNNGTAQPNLGARDIAKYVIPLPPLAEQHRIVARVDELMAKIDELEAVEKELVALKKAFPGDMKASLLQAAMQGKLTQQLPEDGSADDLLASIGAEKEQLIKEKKIKKEKPLAPISEDEIPFDIPDNWEWVRLGEISSYAYPKRKVNAMKAEPDTWMLDMEDIERGGRLLRKKKVRECKAIGDKTIFEQGNILYSKLRPYLLKILIADEDGICTPELIPFDVFGDINKQFIVYFLNSPYVDTEINRVTYGVKMPRVGTDTMVNFCVPLPPLAEQKRIVEKLDKLLPLCDALKEDGVA